MLASQEVLLEAFLRADRLRGFRPEEPPIRVQLFLGGRSSCMVWLVHPGLLDDESMESALARVLALYDGCAPRNGPTALNRSASTLRIVISLPHVTTIPKVLLS